MPFSNNSFVLYNDKQDELIYVIWIKENKDNKYFFKNLGHMKKLNIKDVGERIVFTTYPNINTTFFLSHTEFMKDKNNIKVADEKITDIFKKYNHFHINRINASLKNSQSGGMERMSIYKDDKESIKLKQYVIQEHKRMTDEMSHIVNLLEERVTKLSVYKKEIEDSKEGPQMIRQEDFDEINIKIGEDEQQAQVIYHHVTNVLRDLIAKPYSTKMIKKIITQEEKNGIAAGYHIILNKIGKILLFYNDFRNFIASYNANRIKRNKKNKNRKKQKKKNKKKKEEAGKKISKFLQSRFRGMKSRERTNDLAPFPSGTPNFETVLAQTKEEFPQLKGGKKYSLKRKKKHKYTKAKRRRFRKSKKKKKRKIKTRKNK